MKRSLHANLILLSAILLFVIAIMVRDGPAAAYRMAGGHMATFALSAIIAGLLVWQGRQRNAPQQGLLLLVAGLTFVNSMALTYAPLTVPGFPEYGALNWVGKLLALGFGLIVLWLLPADVRAETGVFRLPDAASRRSVGIGLAVFAALGVALAFSGGAEPGGPLEAALFQLTLPSLGEELLFRGLLLALFARVAANRWRWLGAPAGWSLIASSLLFGLVHGFLFAPSLGFMFQPVPVLATGLLGLGLGWLALRGGSVWPAVIAHSLLNATGPVLRLAGVV